MSPVPRRRSSSPHHRFLRPLVVGLVLAGAAGGGRAQQMAGAPGPGVTAAITPDGQLALSWSDLGHAPPAAFRILRAIGAGDYAVVGEVGGTQTRFTQPLGGVAEPLSYQVVAVDEDGAGRLVGVALVDPRRSPAGATDGTIGVQPGLADPSAHRLSDDAVRLAWVPRPAAAGFRILRSLDGGPARTIAELPRGAAGFTDSVPGLLDHAPRYQIEWVDDAGMTSQPVGFDEIVPRPLAGIARPRATALGADSVRLTWMPGPLAVRFRILRAFPGQSFQEIARLPAGAGQFVDRAPGLLAARPRYEIVWTDANGLDSIPLDFTMAARY